MVKLLLSYNVDDGISGGSGHYRIEYSSKEKLIEDLNKAGRAAISQKHNSFLFLNERMFLSEFDYYEDFGENEVFDISSKVHTLEEWFFQSPSLVEGTKNIEPIENKLFINQSMNKSHLEKDESIKFNIVLSENKKLAIFHSNKINLENALFHNASAAKRLGKMEFEFFGLMISVDEIVNEQYEKLDYKVEEA